MTRGKKYDLFISHASEDKNDLVRPLAKALSEFGLQVWYDEFTLSIGDGLSKAIDKGLADSEFGVVVLSPSFLKKGWPDYELRGLLAREIGSRKVILPIWHKLTRNKLLAYSPSLVDKLALRSDELSTVELAVAIIKVVRPDLFEKIQRRVAYLSMKSETRRMPIKEVKFGPLVHEQLPVDLIVRIRLIRAALLGVYPHSMEFWIDGFRGDAHPSREILIWERIAACYIEYVSMTRLTQKQRKKVFDIITGLSIGLKEGELVKHTKGLPKDAFEKLVQLFKYPFPIYDIEDTPFPNSYKSSNEDEKRFRLLDKEEFPLDVPDHIVRELIDEGRNSKTAKSNKGMNRTRK